MIVVPYLSSLLARQIGNPNLLYEQVTVIDKDSF